MDCCWVNPKPSFPPFAHTHTCIYQWEGQQFSFGRNTKQWTALSPAGGFGHLHTLQWKYRYKSNIETIDRHSSISFFRFIENQQFVFKVYTVLIRNGITKLWALKLIHVYGRSHTGGRNYFIVPQALQRPMQNVNNVWVYLWALLQGPTTVQCSLEWKWYVQTKRGTQAAHSAASFHLRIANECKPPHLVPAGGVPVPPISALLTAGIRQKTGSLNSWGWMLINTFSCLTVPPTYFTAWQGSLHPKVKMWRCLANRAAHEKTGT